MNMLTLTLLEGEVKDIINVLGQMPTQSNAWPLMQKVIAQLNQQIPVTESAVSETQPEQG
jgi:hypothetical protein